MLANESQEIELVGILQACWWNMGKFVAVLHLQAVLYTFKEQNREE